MSRFSLLIPATLVAGAAAVAGCHKDSGGTPDGAAGGGGTGAGGGGGGGGAGATCDHFSPVLESVPWAALASGWSDGGSNVYVVGGRTKVPAILHYDGSSWERMPVSLLRVARPQLLWWAHGFSSKSIFAVGEAGMAITWDGSEWHDNPTATDATLSGVWGSADDDLWAVGGYPGASKERGILLHYTGATWLVTRYQMNAGGDVTDVDIVGDCTEKTSLALSSRALVVKSNLFKVWGSARDDVWAVGTGGTILHYDGKKWHCGGVEPTVSFITVWGRGKDDVFAVGSVELGDPDAGMSRTEAAVYHWDGASWTHWPTPPKTQAALGVWGDGEQVIVVGQGGLAMRTGPQGGDWTFLETGTTESIHQVLQADGTVLAVGGNLLDPAIDRHGFVLGLCPERVKGGAVANTDAGLDAMEPPPKGKGETDPGEACKQDSDCKPGLSCIYVYRGQICTARCSGDPDCFGKGYGSNPCCTASSLAGRDLVCSPASYCPPSW